MKILKSMDTYAEIHPLSALARSANPFNKRNIIFCMRAENQ